MGWTSDARWRCVLGKDWAAFFRLCVGEGWGVGVWGGDLFVLIPFSGFGHSFGGGGVWFADAHYLPHSSAPRSSPTRRRFAEQEIRLILFCLASSFCYCFGRHTRAHTAASSVHAVRVCVSNSVTALSSRVLASACFAAHLWTSPAICMLAWHFHERHTVCYATCARAASLLGHSGRYWRTFLFSGAAYLFSLGLRLSTARPRLRPLPLHEHHRALWCHRPRRWRVSEYVPAVCSAEFGNSTRFPRTAAALL
jgi:hypothetical protein